ncbi:hypothetical protein [Demetria terragena]|uniref:hypothetical protein n=1 Tax=Demetria terragena TaxID=63959 RepID=UPI0003757D65|nr:hypothetical protein [Demetria terragena]
MRTSSATPTTICLPSPGARRSANFLCFDPTGLRAAQVDAVTGIENSLVKRQRDRSLLQMASGVGAQVDRAVTLCRLDEHFFEDLWHSQPPLTNGVFVLFV